MQGNGLEWIGWERIGMEWNGMDWMGKARQGFLNELCLLYQTSRLPIRKDWVCR